MDQFKQKIKNYPSDRIEREINRRQTKIRHFELDGKGKATVLRNQVTALQEQLPLTLAAEANDAKMKRTRVLATA